MHGRQNKIISVSTTYKADRITTGKS